ncbi:MAG: SEC-C domain-containing protein [Campylobacterota bacterium]|nr:SEC-C domain-containing protein [Campylobacterota bacterium]
MLKNMLSYKDTKRNDKCPCGSGIIFKNCCMLEYREAKKKGGSGGVKITSFSPLPPLDNETQEYFPKLYIELMIFSNQYRNNSEFVTIEDEKQNMQSFIQEERIYFYKNAHKIIDKFILDKNPTKDQLEILEALKDAKLDQYFLLSFSDKNAVIMAKNEKVYNIQALNSSFNEIFNLKKRYLGINTALIPYKNRYISDGIYEAFDTTKDMDEWFDNLPYTNPSIHYNKKNKVINIPLVINFAIQCQSEKFELMEDIILRNIPEDFTKSFIELFKNKFSYKVQLISSFLRSTNIATDLNCEEGDQTFSYIIGGTPTTNFEINGDNDIIPYDILKNYYSQKPLSKSASSSVYDNIQKNKKSLFKDLQSQASFYTMLGMIHIDSDDEENIVEFLKTFQQVKQKKKIKLGIDNLFDDLSVEAGFDISAIFLGLGINLDFIYHDIDKYRDYAKKNNILTNNDFKKYGVK